MIDAEDVKKNLRKFGGFSRFYEKKSFHGYRKTAKGKEQEVDVDVEYDNGRYICIATRRDDGKSVTGNPAESLLEAISFVHWYELDK